MTGRPLLLLDIDGTLLPLAPVTDGAMLQYGRMQLPYRPTVIRSLRALFAAGCDINWLTTWEAEASLHLQRRLGLPPMEAPVQWSSQPNWKMHAALTIVAQHQPPVWAWADDSLTARVTRAVSTKHPEALLIRPDERTGLTDDHMDRISRWLLGEPPIAGVVRTLIENVGATVVQAMTGVTDRTAPGKWAKPGHAPSREVEARLRLGYRAWRMVAETEGKHVALAWLVGANPRLGDNTPVTYIYEGRTKEVLGAAAAFVDDTHAP